MEKQEQLVKTNTNKRLNGGQDGVTYADWFFPFSEREARSRGTFISGMPRSGKTNLAKILIRHLLYLGYTIRVFDCSQAWLESVVPWFLIIKPWQNLATIPPVPYEQSVVYDTSRLYPQEQALFIGRILDKDWNYSVEHELPAWIIYVVEEAQLVMPSGSLRARYAQATYRMVSTGRNFKQRYMFITQRPADVSTKALSRVGQAYIGQHWEVNDIQKLSYLLGWNFEKTRNNLSGLKIGEFIYLNPYDKIQVKIKTPLYTDQKKPRNYLDNIQPTKQKSFWEKLTGK